MIHDLIEYIRFKTDFANAYPVKPPQNFTLPIATVKRMSSEGLDWSMDGNNNVVVSHVDITIYAMTYLEAFNLAQLLKKNLQGFNFDQGTSHFHLMKWTNESDDFFGEERVVYAINQSYEITWEPN
jgi:hypothetical protein